MLTFATLKTAWDKLNAPDAPLRRYDRPILYWTTTLILVGAILQTVVNVLDVNLHYSVTYKVKESDLQTAVSTDRLAYGWVDLNHITTDLKDKLPAGARLEGSVPVSVPVDRSRLDSKVLSRLSSVPMDLLAVAIIWLLRQMVLSAVAKPGVVPNPFVWANVRRLRIIGGILFALPLVDSWSQIAAWELFTRSLAAEISIFSWDVSSMFLEFGVGMLVLLLAEVFAVGIRLREDVEGLV